MTERTPTGQAIYSLIRPFLRYLDLEFARPELEVDEFGDEVLGLGFENLYSGRWVKTPSFNIWCLAVGRRDDEGARVEFVW